MILKYNTTSIEVYNTFPPIPLPFLKNSIKCERQLASAFMRRKWAGKKVL